MTAGVVIVGAGQAGFQVAASLRAGGHTGSIQLIGTEAHPPYQRPPLSKGLLLGKMERERLLFRQPSFFATRESVAKNVSNASRSALRAARSATAASAR